MSRAHRIAALAGGLFLVAAGCTRDDDQPPPFTLHGDTRAPGVGVPDSTAPALAVPDTAHAIQPGALRTVHAAPVVGWSGPEGEPFEVEIRTSTPSAQNTRRFGTITLRTSARTRTADLGQYPCSSCHLGRGMVLRDERIEDAHGNIRPVHPAQTAAVCSTCHAPDNVQLLALRSGERPMLDHAYRLCAQCHYRQVESWANGAHGKRLDGWQGRRVVMGCADCHDPHRPAIGPRVPFRAPRLERHPR